MRQNNVKFDWDKIQNKAPEIPFTKSTVDSELRESTETSGSNSPTPSPLDSDSVIEDMATEGESHHINAAAESSDHGNRPRI